MNFCSPLEVKARPKLNLTDTAIFPLGKVTRVFVVPHPPPQTVSATREGAQKGLHAWTAPAIDASSITVYWVPAVDVSAPLSQWQPPKAQNSYPVHWKDADAALTAKDTVPYGELHKAYLCLSQTESRLRRTPVFDHLAMKQAFDKLSTEAHLEAADLIERMRDAFGGYALRRDALDPKKIKVSASTSRLFFNCLIN